MGDEDRKFKKNMLKLHLKAKVQSRKFKRDLNKLAKKVNGSN